MSASSTATKQCGCGCGVELSGRQRSWASPECQKTAAREKLLMERFGITPAEYKLILATQGGVCPICGKKPDPSKPAFPVDHDHKTGFIRGICCVSCNLWFIGRRTAADRFRAAADYLDNPPAIAAIGERVAPGRKKTPRRKRKSYVVGAGRRGKSRRSA